MEVRGSLRILLIHTTRRSGDRLPRSPVAEGVYPLPIFIVAPKLHPYNKYVEGSGILEGQFL